MAPPSEMEELLAKMVTARDELRETIGMAHAARKDLLGTIKTETDTLRSLIAETVTAAVEVLGDAAAERMRDQVIEVITRIERDWREKLGLS